MELVGVVAGLIMTVICIELIHHANIITEMPGASVPFQIKIDFLTSSLIYAAILSISASLVATIVPSYRASKMEIVEALRKNI